MRQHHYTFITEWRLDSPLEPIWEHVLNLEESPRWWPGVIEAKLLKTPYGKHEVGSTIATVWKSWLPYKIRFTLTLTKIEPRKQIIADASGDLVGTGTWDLWEEGNQTIARYTWKVSTTKAWMNFLAPVARPIFAHAHDLVMKWGEQGLKKELAARAKTT